MSNSHFHKNLDPLSENTIIVEQKTENDKDKENQIESEIQEKKEEENAIIEDK